MATVRRTARRGIVRRFGRWVGRSALGKLLSSTATTTLGWMGVGYNALDPRRKMIQNQILANRRTANELINGALPPLRSHCRDLLRNNQTAISIADGHQALIVGTGITLEPTGKDEKAVDAIRDQWQKWQACCGVNGESMTELQRQGIYELDGAGEVVWRYVYLPDLADAGEIPVRIMALESEWIADQVVKSEGELTAVNGILVDKFGRERRFLLLNPSQDVSAEPEEVDAADINHIYERKRPLSNRGIPGLAHSIENLMNAQDLVDVELYAAKQTSAMALVITSDIHPDAETDIEVNGTETDPAHNVKAGAVARMFPGERVEAFNHNRPTPGVAEFDKFLRGKIAGSSRISSGFLDRDYTRANYSSRKAEQIDNNMILGPVRNWYGECTGGRAFKKVLPFLAVAGGVSARGISYRLIPDEVPFLDPVKDTMGILLSIAGGLTNFEREIGKRGGNAREIHQQLQKEITDNPLLAQVWGSNLPSALSAAAVQSLANGETPEESTHASE